MQIVWADNFLNHHVFPICAAFREALGNNFLFIATEPTEQERLKLGYADMNRSCDFVFCAYDGAEKETQAAKLCRECNILIIGAAPVEYARRRAGKITFFYSERLFKENGFSWKTLPRMVKYTSRRGLYREAYLLCASAYAAQDYAQTGNFIGRGYKWGYFPEVRRYDPDALMMGKRHSETQILWVGRMIDWKHPESAIEMAKRLSRDRREFHLTMIGTGSLENELKRQIEENGLENCVTLPGAMPPERVREYMEQANVFLFTSDCGEGWGAVMNEAMNSGCAVVAADGIGAVPYLLRNGENGLVFRSEDWDDLYKKVKRLMDDSMLREQLGRAAYQTMVETWNAEVAAQRLLRLADCLRLGEDTPFADGPCSRA